MHPPGSNGPEPRTLTDEEAAAVLSVVEELQAAPSPRDPRPVGCLTAIAAVAGLVAVPWLAGNLGLGIGAARATAVVLVLALIIGGLLAVFGGGFVSGAVRAEVERSLARLEEGQLDLPVEVLRRATVRILLDAHIVVGPTSVRAYDPEAAAARLGDALPYVLAVERLLLDGGSIYPVFTADEP